MYHVVYGILWMFSLLPLRVLYVLADCIYGFIFYINKYRRRIVMDNLRAAFPEKTEKERLKIAKRFYHNLVDTMVETIKLTSASQKFIHKHFAANWDLVNEVASKGRKVQLHLGHNFNWEWGNAEGGKHVQFPFIVVYMPLNNKIFERFLYRLRSRTGSLLIRATHMRADLMPHRNKQYVIVLVADQNPGHPANAMWFNFLNRPAPFLYQPAKNAILNDAVILFGFIRKKKRGYYELVFSVMEENVKQKTDAELTAQFVGKLEDVIRQYPDMWLWSHRRWKHQWKEEYGPVRESI